MDYSNFNKDSKMCELISTHYEVLNVLSRFDIALGFGEKTIKEVCSINKVDYKAFLAVVNLITGKKEFGSQEDQENSLPSIAEYLKLSHNYFIDFKLPIIRTSLEHAINNGSTDIKFLILKYFDEYADEVKKHMEYENDFVFPYLKTLLDLSGGKKGAQSNYNIHIFKEQHNHIEVKLSELKDIIIKYYPTHSTNELNSVLYDIFVCAKDLESHHKVEEELFVPAIERLEQKIGKVAIKEKEGDSTPCPDSLSDREREILICIVHGLTNKEIASKLFLSTHTVNTHRRNIISKLQIHSPAGLTIYAIVNKLVELNDIKI